jgi:NAD+ synthase (glutamine-hydrolysing)
MTKYCSLKVGLAQMNSNLGDLPKNKEKIIDFIKKGEAEDCDFILFPELAITGYPIQDLVFIHEFVENNLKIIKQIQDYVTKSIIIVGCVTKNNREDSPLTPFYNSAAIIYPKSQNREIIFVHKRLLPNYDVFDEKRYFATCEDFPIIEYKGLKIGVEICEDAWDSNYSTKVTENLKKLGANCILNINASPYYVEKPQIRDNLIKTHAKNEEIPFVYLNMVGGQDEITFDGRSVVVDSLGRTILRLPSFQEVFRSIELPVPVDDNFNDSYLPIIADFNDKYNDNILEINDDEEIYKALVLNLRDYYTKVGVFKKIVLGVSGGIDSSITAAIACAAVGPENVVGISMPSKYSSDHSVDDAHELSSNLGMKYIKVPIKEIHDVFEKEMHEAFKVDTFTLAEENLQARIRGTILMYYSNKFDALLVSTGNKSEIAVGYCTLYGDTNGGKNVPGDLFKWRVYSVSKWINENSLENGGKILIPVNSIKKAPSAELRHNQTDQDSLPEYDVLDAILTEFIENDRSIDEIEEMGYNRELILRIEKLYYNAEFKRSQLGQTIKVTKKSFGTGRRIPINNKYHYARDKI